MKNKIEEITIDVRWRPDGEDWEPYTEDNHDEPFILMAFWSVVRSEERMNDFFSARSAAEISSDFEKSIGESFAWLTVYGHEEITNEKSVVELCFDMTQDCLIFMPSKDALETALQISNISKNRENKIITVRTIMILAKDI